MTGARDAPVYVDVGRDLNELVARERKLAEMVRWAPSGTVHLWRFQLVEREPGRQAGRDGPDTRTLAQVLLRHILAAYLHIPAGALRMERTKHGKPFIFAPVQGPYDLRFNMSHSGASIAIVLATGHDCGVDIEERCDDVDVDPVLRFCGTRQEVEAFSRLNSEQGVRDHFWRFWTLKEAITKAMGVGLQYPLRHLDVYRPSLFKAPVVDVVLNLADRRFVCHCALEGRQTLAVAIIADEPTRTVASPLICIDPIDRRTSMQGVEHDS